MERTKESLRTLFKDAKQRSEFDFVLTLINYKGMGSHKLTTNLHEWFDAIEFYKVLYYSNTGKEKTRIGTLLYSTFFENSDFYNIIGSLCRIKLGYKGSSYLFWKTKKQERLLGIGEKQEFLLELLDDAGKEDIINFFFENHVKQIRNTFYHSAYSLSDDGEYILHDSEAIKVGELLQSSFDVGTFLYPKVENVIAFFDEFKSLYLESFDSYQEDKEVMGLFPNISKITLLGTSNGLKGFKIKNATQFYGVYHDSGIEYREDWDMWVGNNISNYYDNIETIEIKEQLTRYENKEDINKNDSEFNNLIDKVKERNNSHELIRAINLLAKFGKMREDKMQVEENHHKKNSYSKMILPFYKKAVELGDKIADMSLLKKKIKEFEG